MAGDPVLSALSGLTRGLVAGIEGRKRQTMQEREMALREKQAAAREAYYQQKSGATALQDTLTQSKIAQNWASVEQKGTSAVQAAQKQVKDIQARTTEITGDIATLEKRLSTTQDPTRQKAYQDRLAQLQTERDTLASNQDVLSQQISKKAGTKAPKHPAKYAPWFNFVERAPDIQTINNWAKGIKFEDLEPSVREDLIKAVKARAYDLQSGAQEPPMIEETQAPLEE